MAIINEYTGSVSISTFDENKLSCELVSLKSNHNNFRVGFNLLWDGDFDFLARQSSVVDARQFNLTILGMRCSQSYMMSGLISST
jgi:hypothetical protein